uniref:Reverse transcriptase Ty1/copia-type domain-containing protein n=1 Tax=Cajanus cajan TaxID=3821 RepID=A0A151U1E6_CAJCA|nr:hypothetical protein KK1_005765 [Cajanus cajan]
MLYENIYIEQPLGMVNPQFSNHVCKLQKALYDFKQTPRTWFDCFSSFLLKYGFFFVVWFTHLYLFGTLILDH